MGKEILVDNYFPYNTKRKTLHYAKAVDKRQYAYNQRNKTIKMELWVPIIEKACAKAAGSYEELSGGQGHVGLSLLTGYNACMVQMGNMSTDELFERLLSYDKKNYLMSASIKNIKRRFWERAPVWTARKDHLRTLGVHGDHAYTVVGAHKCQKNGETVRLVELRNPHGLGGREWNGEWSDASPNWTRELKRQCNWTNERDGRFFMSAEDFHKYFTNYKICKYGKEGEEIPECCPECNGEGTVWTNLIFGKVIPYLSSSKSCPTCQVKPLRKSYWHPEPISEPSSEGPSSSEESSSSYP